MQTPLAGRLASGKRLAFVSFTLVVLVVLAGALAEMAYRVFAPQPEVFDLSGLHEFRPDREWLYRGKPGVEGELWGTHYKINADGFRGPVHERPRPPGGRRIVVLGDSIAFGFGVREEETFPRVLERLLAERAPEARVEVINLGTGGYSAWNEARLLEDVGIGYEPDIVLLQFSINDLNDPTTHFGTQTKLVLGTIPEAAFPNAAGRTSVDPARRTLLRACHLLRLCTALHQRIADSSEPEPLDPESRRAFLAPVESTERVEWRWLEDRYDEMAATTRTAGADFVVLSFPYQKQLRGTGSHPVSQHLQDLAQDRGWLLADPLDAFRRARRRGRKLFIDNWHPTITGHRIAAEETLRTLACGGLLGTDVGPAIVNPPCETQ